MRKFKLKWWAEDCASEIAPNHTEMDKALLDLIDRFDETDTARQKATAEKKNTKLRRSLCRHKTCEMLPFKHLVRPGKRKKMIRVNVRKKRSRRST